jgi:hypothetical protein
MFLYSRHNGYSRSCLYGLLLGCLLGLMGQVHAQDDSNRCEKPYVLKNSPTLGYVCWALSADETISENDILYYPYGASSEMVRKVPATYLHRFPNCPTPYNLHRTLSGKEVCMKYVMIYKDVFWCHKYEPDRLTFMPCESLILDNSQ